MHSAGGIALVFRIMIRSVFSSTAEGHTIYTLYCFRVSLMCSYHDFVKAAIIASAAMIFALLYTTFYAFVGIIHMITSCRDPGCLQVLIPAYLLSAGCMKNILMIFCYTEIIFWQGNFCNIQLISYTYRNILCKYHTNMFTPLRSAKVFVTKLSYFFIYYN